MSDDDKLVKARHEREVGLRLWQATFIDRLAAGASISDAARGANVSRQTAYKYREKDPLFAAAWDDAVETVTDEIEQEAIRRAVKGVQEDIYFKGEKVGEVTKYSDPLMTEILRARRPNKYRPNVGESGAPPLVIELRLPDDRGGEVVDGVAREVAPEAIGPGEFPREPGDS